MFLGNLAHGVLHGGYGAAADGVQEAYDPFSSPVNQQGRTERPPARLRSPPVDGRVSACEDRPKHSRNPETHEEKRMTCTRPLVERSHQVAGRNARRISVYWWLRHTAVDL
jgi:hypothetical protein